MRHLRTTDKYIFNWQDGALLAVWAIANVAFGAFVIKRSYFEGFHDYEESFVNFKPRN